MPWPPSPPFPLLSILSPDTFRVPFFFYEFVVLANLWSIDDVDKEFIVSMDIIKDIYMGKINKWNDSRLTTVNPGKVVTSEWMNTHIAAAFLTSCWVYCRCCRYLLAFWSGPQTYKQPMLLFMCSRCVGWKIIRWCWGEYWVSIFAVSRYQV